ncbi:MAG: transporter substrate-binding domain-containing protein [Coriobacteriia bacterium]|nr:transporter substrate-binding domain-containing protein [Coriobacteriia bacterium]
MKKLVLLGLAAALLVSAFGLAGCGSKKPADNGASTDASNLPAQVQAIKDRGTLNVGVKQDVPGFGQLNPKTNQFEGMEIDMAHSIGKEIFGSSYSDSKVKFFPVTADTRGTLLDNGQIDMVIATFTIKPDRKLKWNFSDSYYTDGVGLMVKKTSGISGIKDLSGKTVAVATGATSQQAVEDEAKTEGVTGIKFQQFPNYAACTQALQSGRVDAFSVDRSILAGYLNDSFVILPDKFSPQDYGIATKLSNKDLASWVNDLVVKWKSDGTIDGLITKYAQYGLAK